MNFYIDRNKWTIRKFVNMLAVHIKGIRHPPYSVLTVFDTLFHVNVPISPTSSLICGKSGIGMQSAMVVINHVSGLPFSYILWKSF
jgi:hypothetical protein